MATNPAQITTAWGQVLDSVHRCWHPERWRDVGVVVGCSGGADSTALACALAELRRRSPDSLSTGTQGQRRICNGFVVLAHMNHRLRGEESEGDATFVSELSRHLGVRFAVDHDDGTATDEATLRTRRLDFLVRVAKQTGARYVVLGHHRDDRVETVIHHLVRGTGPTGVAGMRPFRNLEDDLVLVRPLLTVTRRTIQLGLQARSQTWRDDRSNNDDRYRRNWIRHTLIPMFESRFPKAADSIARLANTMDQWVEVMDGLADDWLDRHLVPSESYSAGSGRQEECAILYDSGGTAPAVVVHALQRLWTRRRWPLQAMSHDQWHRLAETLVRSTTPMRPFHLPGGIRVSDWRRGRHQGIVVANRANGDG